MKQGDAFLGGGEIHGEHHLWLVINNPAAHGDVALIVNVTTLRLEADSTCIVAPGEHPFIKQDSYVRYSGARRVRVADLTDAVRRGLLKTHQAAGQALLEKVHAGAQASPHLPRELLAWL